MKGTLFHYHMNLANNYLRSQNGQQSHLVLPIRAQINWTGHFMKVTWFYKTSCALSLACKTLQTLNSFIAIRFRSLFFFLFFFLQQNRKPSLSIILFHINQQNTAFMKLTFCRKDKRCSVGYSLWSKHFFH